LIEEHRPMKISRLEMGQDWVNSAYTRPWSHFVQWCLVNDRAALPCTVPTLIDYVTQLYKVGKKTWMLNIAIGAIGHHLRICGFDDLSLDPQFQRFLEDAQWTTTEHKAGSAISLDDLKAMSRACGDELAGLRNRSLLLLTFDGWFRHREALTLQCEQLTWEAERVIVRFKHPQIHQRVNRTTTVELRHRPSTEVEICYYSALRRWMDAAGVIEGPVFRKIHNGKATACGLSDGNWLGRLLRDLARRTGVQAYVASQRTSEQRTIS
jgi:hypothetical protein